MGEVVTFSVLIEVSAEDVAAAEAQASPRANPCLCPVARAVRRRLPACDVAVWPSPVVAGRVNLDHRPQPLPALFNALALAWDAGCEVVPCCAELEVAVPWWAAERFARDNGVAPPAGFADDTVLEAA